MPSFFTEDIANIPWKKFILRFTDPFPFKNLVIKIKYRVSLIFQPIICKKNNPVQQSVINKKYRRTTFIFGSNDISLIYTRIYYYYTGKKMWLCSRKQVSGIVRHLLSNVPGLVVRSCYTDSESRARGKLTCNYRSNNGSNYNPYYVV